MAQRLRCIETHAAVRQQLPARCVGHRPRRQGHLEHRDGAHRKHEIGHWSRLGAPLPKPCSNRRRRCPTADGPKNTDDSADSSRIPDRVTVLSVDNIHGDRDNPCSPKFGPRRVFSWCHQRKQCSALSFQRSANARHVPSNSATQTRLAAYLSKNSTIEWPTLFLQPAFKNGGTDITTPPWWTCGSSMTN